MKLPELGVRRPIGTFMIFVCIIALGLISLTFLGLDLMPEIEVPSVMIVTRYTGAGPQEVEERVSKPIEEKVSTISDIDKVESISSEGMSIVLAKFDWGIDLEEATNEIRDQIDQAKYYIPDEVEEPILFKFDMSMMPILIYGVKADESYPKLRKILEDKISDPLMKLPGVATVVIQGGLEREIQVNIDRQKLEAYELSIQQVVQAVGTSNLSVPGGHLKWGKTDYLVRTPEEYQCVDDIGSLVVGVTEQGVPIHLNKIADVIDGHKEQVEKALVNEHPGLGLMIQKQSGANTVNIARKVLEEIEKLKKDLPSDVELIMIRDFSDYIERSIVNLKDAVIWGGVLVILVIILFLRNIRASLIVAVSIPTSLVITFLMMFIADYTLNIMTVSSLAIAIGMVVDDAIVILENVYRHRERGERAAEGTIAGASEVGLAVTAATFTIVVIFFPIIFMGGVTGVLFKQLAVIICLAILTSLITSLTLVPMLSSKLVKENKTYQSDSMVGRLFSFTEKLFVSVEEAYGSLLSWSLKHKGLIFVSAFIILVSTVLVVGIVGTEFMPEQDSGFLTVNAEFPVGTRMEVTEKIARKMEQIIREKVPESEVTYVKWGYSEKGTSALLGNEEGAHIAMVNSKLVKKQLRQRSVTDIVRDIRPYLESYPGAHITFSTEDVLSSLMFGGSPLCVEIRGYDSKTAQDLSEKVAAILEHIEGVEDVAISRKAGKPELQISIERDKAAALGLNVAKIANTVKQSISGIIASTYRERGDEYDIKVRLMEKDRGDIKDLEQIPIMAYSGELVRLKNIADISYKTGPIKIERSEQERIVKITGNIFGRDLGSVVAEADEKISQLTIPDGFNVYFGGAREEQEESFRLLFIALFLSVLLVYIVMAVQFESLRDPFIMIFSVPFAIVGGLWSVLLLGMNFSVVSFISIIMLVGIVVKNGIVLIDYINILRARGFSLEEAVQAGGKHRLRPVLMTAFTTFFGLLPLALSRVEGSEVWVSLSIPVMGGLLFSTIVTLIFAPTLYAAFEVGFLKKKATFMNKEQLQGSS